MIEMQAVLLAELSDTPFIEGDVKHLLFSGIVDVSRLRVYGLEGRCNLHFGFLAQALLLERFIRLWRLALDF